MNIKHLANYLCLKTRQTYLLMQKLVPRVLWYHVGRLSVDTLDVLPIWSASYSVPIATFPVPFITVFIMTSDS